MGLLASANAVAAPSSPADSAPAAVEQQSTVTGTVKDSFGDPLPGVAVSIKGTRTGTTTDLDGKYSIQAPAGAVLEFSFIGMKTKSVTVGDSKVIDVVLEDDATVLDEVIAIGYGFTKKRDLTGAVSTVSADDMLSGGTVSNAAIALQGKSAGVEVRQSSAAPGGTISVRIRGNNSIRSTNEPLYVIDGFPSQNGMNVNPADIETMQILKDASATAIYGARGANGVVLITTKRGKSGENKISYDGYLGAQQVVNPFTMLSGKEYMELSNALYKEIEGQEGMENGAYTPSQLQNTTNTNWIEECMRMGIVQNHNVTFRGGSDKTKVMTSLGIYGQDGVLKNTDFNRLSGRVNVDQTINEWIKAGASVYAHRETSNYQEYSGNILNSNVLLSVLTYDPTVKPYENGVYGRPPGGRGDNPLANLMERKNDKTTDKLNGTMFVEVSPLKGLTAKVTGGTEILHSFRGTYLPVSTFQGSQEGGVASTYDYASTRTLLETLVTYTHKFGEDHDFSVMGGYTHEKFDSHYDSMTGKGFSTDLFMYNNMNAAGTITAKASNKTENILISFFGRVNYSYKDKYLLTATVRRDGSSRFGAQNRWGTFPSASLAWRIGEEPWIKDLNVFSNLKLRAGYGVTGNERIGDYQSFALMSTTRYTYDGETTTSGVHLNTSNAENQNLKWETTAQANVGLDMGFVNDRIAITLDAYYKKTSDLLLARSLPLYTGFTSGVQNIGSMANKGIELEVATQNFVGDFDWETKFNISANRNRILDIGGDDIYITSSKPVGTVSEEAYALLREGEPLGTLFGYKYIGVLQAGETYKPQPNAKPGDPKFEDVSGPDGKPDGEIDAYDRTIIGNANPKFTFGLTNNFAWKGFDASIFIQGAVGYDLLNMTRMNLEWKHTTDALNRWTPSNTNTDIPRNGFYYSKYGGYINDHFIEDASYVRLKTVTLGYTIPFKKVVSSARIYVQADNLLTLTKYSGWDPETDTKATEAGGEGGQTANAGAGLDFNSYPAMRSFTAGISITF